MLGRVGVCSWSLQPSSPDDLASKVRRARLHRVQLALDPIRRGQWAIDGTLAALRRERIEIGSGMMAFEGEDYSTLESIRETGGVRLDEHWESNLAASRANAALAERLGVGLVTFHAGFLPHSRRDPLRSLMLDRLRQIADVFAARRVSVGLETGQESAETLLHVLDDLGHPNVGINFDPANMILYGMGDPIEALRRLLPRVVQVHVKDARAAAAAGTWGEEVPVGRGEVDWSGFCVALHESRRRFDLMIEREAGESRVQDVAAARVAIEPHVWKSSFAGLTPAPHAVRPVVRVGVVGLGFMGATHIRAYESANAAGFACRVEAVSDHHADRLSGRAGTTGNIGGSGGARLFDPTSTRVYGDAARLLRDPAIDLVSICTHTDTHVSYAIEALRHGKHVLVEKPVALDPRAAEELASAAAKSGRLCMPAMCMRFWPAWSWLKDRIDDGSFGPVLSAVFQRLGTRPPWATEFYADTDRSGGALADLHIHDADFVSWCFGQPERVISTGSIHHLTTLYQARACGHLLAEGGWDHAPGWAFRMRFVVVFADATVDFEIGRNPALSLYRDGQAEVVALPQESGYDGEVRHMLDAIQRGQSTTSVTVDDAVAVARLLEAERRSLESGLPVQIA